MKAHSDKKKAHTSDDASPRGTRQARGPSPISPISDNRPQPTAQLQIQSHADTSESTLQTVQLQQNTSSYTPSIQFKANRTGLPDQLKSGIESMSGHSLDDVNVHYNSSKPAQLNAHAYAQGTDIHLASGQEKHLPHEAWHVVQQKQGRVKPTMQMKAIGNAAGEAVVQGKFVLYGVNQQESGEVWKSNNAFILRLKAKYPKKDAEAKKVLGTIIKSPGDYKVTRKESEFIVDVPGLDKKFENENAAFDFLIEHAAKVHTFSSADHLVGFLNVYGKEEGATTYIDSITASAKEGSLSYDDLVDNFHLWTLIKKGYTAEQAHWAIVVLKRKEMTRAKVWIDMAKKFKGDAIYSFIANHIQDLNIVYTFLTELSEKSKKDKEFSTVELAIGFDAFLKKSKKKLSVKDAPFVSDEVAAGGGIPNTGSDCFMNSVFQILSMDAYDAVELPEPVRAIITKVKNGNAVAATETRAVRTYLSRLGIVERASDRHEDAAELMNKLLPMFNNKVKVQERRQINMATAQSPADLGVARRAVNDQDIQYAANGSRSTDQAPDSMLRVPVSETDGLVEWFNHMHGTGHTDTFRPNVARPASIEWAAVNGAWQSVKERKTFLSFKQIPDVLTISLNRFSSDLGLAEKNSKPFAMPTTFTLTEEGDQGFVRKTYSLKGFVYHRGGLGGGHYWAHRKTADVWNKAEDETVAHSDVNPEHTNEGSLAHDINNGYIYTYQCSASANAAAWAAATSVDGFALPVAEEPDAHAHEDHDTDSSTSKDKSGPKSKQVWYGIGSLKKGKTPSADNETSPDTGCFNEGPCAQVATDILKEFENTAYENSCMIGVVLGISGQYYVTMSGKPVPQFKRAVEAYKKTHSITLNYVQRSNIAQVRQKTQGKNAQQHILASDVATFKGKSDSDALLTNYPVQDTKKESAMGSPGTCALPKMFADLIKSGDVPKHVSEKWYSPKNKADLDAKKKKLNNQVSVLAAENDAAATSYNHGDTIPSCKTCRHIVPHQLSGIQAQITAFRKTAAKKIQAIKEHNELLATKLAIYTVMVTDRLAIFTEDPRIINTDLLDVKHYVEFRAWYQSLVEMLISNTIDTLMEAEKESEKLPKKQTVTVTAQSSTGKKKDKQKKEKKVKKVKAKVVSKPQEEDDDAEDLQEPTEEVVKETDPFKIALNTVLSQFAALKAAYNKLPAVVFTPPNHSKEKEASSGFIFSTGKAEQEDAFDPELGTEVEETRMEIFEALNDLQKDNAE